MAGSLYNAPQFFDFNEIDEEDDDDNGYFEHDPLNTSDYHNETTLIVDDLYQVKTSNQRNFRRSISVGDLLAFKDNIKINKLSNGAIRKHYVPIENGLRNVQIESTSGATSSRRRTSSQDMINRLALPKTYKSDQDLNRNEYVPMAEAVNKFQSGTPKRFRSKPNLKHETTHLTIAQSPKLKTAIRSRPVYTVSYKEQEERILEEAKKSQFKANPLNKKIFQSPTVTSVKAKKSTIPEPFKLTAPPKKVGDSPIKKAPEFHARPVPKYVYEPQRPVIKAPMKAQNTKPVTPSFMRCQNATKTAQNKNETTILNETVQQPKLKPTRPLPFSFEARDRFVKSRKEKLIRDVMDAERKAREFHAKPVPKAVLQRTRHESQTSLEKTKSEEKINATQFKAKPPTVLYKKPFEPKLEPRPLIEIDEFVLNTDLRRREREQFELILKEKEERVKMLREREETIRKQEESEEIMKARKNAEFKAQEIKKYKEVILKPSKKVTTPVSPKFLSNLHSGNKENTPQHSTS